MPLTMEALGAIAVILVAFLALLVYQFLRIQTISAEKVKALHDLNERMKEITCLFQVNEIIKNPEVNIPGVMKEITRLIPKGWHYPEKTTVEIVLDKKTYQSQGYRESKDYLLENILVNGRERGYVKVTVFDLDIQQTHFVSDDDGR